MSRKRKARFLKFPVKQINKQVSKKLVGLFLVVILALVALAIRITYINATSGADYTRIVLQNNQQQYGNTTIAYKRGDISDRNGTLLASSERVYRLIFDCSVVNYEVTDDDGKETQPYIEPTVKALVKFFKIDEDYLYELLEADETKDSQYIVLKTDITIEQKEEFEEYTDLSDEGRVDELTEEEYYDIYYINGVWFEDSYKRVYPQNSLACDLIGFVNSSNEADWGIEGYYSEVLNGTNGRSFGYINADAEVEQTIVEAVDGNNVISTCDINIQEIVRNCIENFSAEYENGPNGEKAAKNIGVVVMDPDNGEILAMDSTDWYDLNDPRDLSDYLDAATLANMTDEEEIEYLNAMWRNFCISDAYEPGSTFKPMAAAAALETDVVKEDSEFTCDGYEDINGQIIRCSSYPETHGTLTTKSSLVVSCNDALMQMSYSLGTDSMLKYQSIFNFGAKTGIDLPGENTGILYDDDTMGTIELATTSFGQGFTCTMIQEAAAMAALINGGYYYTPHVVKSITDSDGNLIESIDATVRRQVVSKEISDFIKSALKETVESGTGTLAKVEGYSIGGKTGTAQKIPRSAGTYVVSFIGFAPVEDPEVLVYVVIDELNVYPSLQGMSDYAQKLSKDIFAELLPYMNIYPEAGSDSEDTTDEAGGTGDTADGAGSEDSADNENLPEPLEDEEDDTVLYGGNDLYSDGIDNDAF